MPPTSVAVTVRGVDPDILPDVAVIVVVPVPADVANPELLIVTTPVFEEIHVIGEVISFVELSE